MVTDSIHLLCTGDIHLGRHPTRIPEPLDGRSLSPRAVWQSTVEYAIDYDVDAVLISGDVIDRENRYYEAYGAFEEGATKLDEAGIPMLVVAGNHDFDSLPKLVQDLDIDCLELLGTDGNWERYTLTRDGKPLFHVDGWSFPEEYVFESPLEDYDLSPADEPVIGLLHGDLDNRGSQYAPVESAELEATALDAWLLGHIHTPNIHNDTDPVVFYPGTPQALDPGNQGTHGPWELRYNDREIDIEQVPLASVRYDTLQVDASGVEESMDVPSLVQDSVKAHIRTNVSTGSLEVLSIRVRLTGRTPAHGELVRNRETIEEDLEFKVGALPVHIDELQVDTTPEVDLQAVADEDTPVGYIADLLLSIEKGNHDEYDSLIEDASNAMQNVYNAGTYSPLRREGELDSPSTEDTVDLLDRQGRLLIHELLEQTEGEA